MYVASLRRGVELAVGFGFLDLLKNLAYLLTFVPNFKTEEDAKRDADLQAMGFTVLRFSDREVMQDIENVRRTLEIWIEERTGDLP